MRNTTEVRAARSYLSVSEDGVASIIFEHLYSDLWCSVSMPFSVMFDEEFSHESLEAALESVDLLTMEGFDDSD